MKLPKFELAVNLSARLVAAALSFLAVPFYIEILGVESYGLIGFFTTLQLVFFILEMGLGGAFTREVAALSSTGDAVALALLGRTLELLFLILAVTIGIIVFFLSGAISGHWLVAESLTVEEVDQSVRLMGFVVAVQLPFLLYQAGLLGVQHHLQLNLLLIVVYFLRYLGVIGVLLWIDASISTYFIWQLFVSLFQSICARLMLFYTVKSKCKKPYFDFRMVKNIWRFAAGMAAISITSVILTQVDKLVLSKLLTLQEFGYYSLAVLMASVPYLFASPFYNVYYPKLTALVSEDDANGLAADYRAGSQLIATIIFPVGMSLVFLSEPIVNIWLQDVNVSGRVYPLLSVLAMGTTLLGIMHMPYALQLAHGWTRLTLIVNVVSIVVLLPSMIFLVERYGAIAACYTWLALNVGYILVTIQVMHRRLLLGELKNWYTYSLCYPLLITGLVSWLVSSVYIGAGIMNWPILMQLLILAVSFLVIVSAGLLSTPVTREIVANFIRKYIEV